MPRNGSGSYSLPEPPFVPLTTISSAAVNSDLSDIGTALTGSLARDGQGGMTAVLPLNAAGFSYTNDTNTGMYRSGSDAQAIKCGGSDIIAVTTSGASVTGDLSVTGTITQDGAPLINIGEGRVFFGSTAPDKWVFAAGQALSRTTYADLFAVIGTTYGSGDGSTTFNVPDVRGRSIFGRDDMGGSAAGRLTNTTMSPSGIALGATGGSQTVTLSQSNLPNTQLAVTGNISINNSSNFIAPTGSATPNSFQGGPDGSTFQSTFFSTISLTGSLSGGLTASMNGNVTQAAINKMNPAIIANYIIYAGV